MQATTTIEPLDANETLFVLKDERGVPMGTGTEEVMRVLAIIASRAEPTVAYRPPVPPSKYSAANLRSALVF
jgi:hypothetical protein